jgi:hypothetical protein
MATKADFTEQEWETLERGVTGAGFLVALSDRGFFDTFKEAGALSRHLREARENQSSELVRDFAETRGTGFGVTDKPDEIERETMGALGEASRILDEKAPDEKEAYRSFVLEVAQSVADAAGGGETAESATIEKLRAALA